MKEVIVPVTMTSLVNASMFAILNISDIPAIYLTAQVADYCVIALYCAIVFCYPAFCFLDMKRQTARKRDICFCLADKSAQDIEETEDFRSVLLYDKFYQPIMLGNRSVRLVSHSLVWLIAAALLGVGFYGIAERKVGLGLEDFFPLSNPASVWATKRTEALASWTVVMNWGALQYTDSDEQMKIIKQFEDIVATPHIADVDTKRLWIADFIMWTTPFCSENFDRKNFDVRECGQDKLYEPEGTTCSGAWVPNSFGLRTKIFSDYNDTTCYATEGGICRPFGRLYPADQVALVDADKSQDFCPVISGWSDDLWKFCLVQWRNATGYSGDRFVLSDDHGSDTNCAGEYNNDEEFVFPIPFSSAPTLFAFDLFSHEDTLSMLRETRAICDDNTELRCWMAGIPSDYWQQYLNIFHLLIVLSSFSTLVGFAISFAFLFAKLLSEQRHTVHKVFWGSLIGALLIALTIIFSLIAVIGISILVGVKLTGFSNMSFVLS
jgi:Sterol-sensing domain of SREBP cleavage-activation